MRRLPIVLALLSLAACAGIEPRDTDRYTRPLTPEEAVADFRIDPNFRVEVFAAEPYVRDPVDLAFDEHGRAFVAEMLDYPHETDVPPGSRIRRLIDRNGDGRIDDAVVFADSLRLVTGIQPWDGGLIVTAAPDVLFLRDADGDGRADERRTLFTGFAEANPQHRVASPRFALDNWIYIANDGVPGLIRPVDVDSGGASGSAGRGARARAQPVSVLGTDFRFQLPLSSGGELRYEAAAGPAQFGQAFDAFGRRFITHNTVHVRHVILPRRYFERNPYLVAARTAHDISDHGLRVVQRSDPQAWRVARTDTRRRRYEAEGLDRTEARAHVFTAVAGAAISGDSVYPPEYHGNLFVGETAANLVHRDVLTPSGATFTAARGEPESEFLSATDPWFRPANVVVGPDGYLYVVDMYRAVIESPEYIPESIRRDLDFRRGTEYGRIYRIVPGAAQMVSGGSSDVVADLSTSELVDLLGDSNPWRRLTAHRLLRERGDLGVTAALENLARGDDRAVNQAANQVYARAHALNVMAALELLSEDIVADALADPHAGVREHAFRLAERFPDLARRVADLAEDSSPRVRLQAALTLGSISSAAGDSALIRLAARDGADPWFATAVLSAPPDRAMSLLEGLIDHQPELVEDLAAVVGARADENEIARLLARVRAESADRHEAVLSGLARGFALRGFRQIEMPIVRRALRTTMERADEAVRQSATRTARYVLIPELAAEAARRASDANLPRSRRAAAAANLVMGRFDDVRSVLLELLDSGDAVLQAAALQTLGGFADDRASALVLDRWDAIAPALRPEAAAITAAREAGLIHLLDALEGVRVPVESLTMDVRLRLLDHPNDSIRERAAAIIETSKSDVATDVLGLDGDAEQGRDVFYRECARCHASGGLGPDLVGVSNKSAEQLLEAIVAPSAAIPATYAAHVVQLDDGSVVSGRVVREMPGTLTLRSEREERTVLRSDVRAIRTALHSLMPDDYGRRLTHRELAGLISFLKAGS